jgi:electron transport complex protein RnfB
MEISSDSVFNSKIAEYVVDRIEKEEQDARLAAKAAAKLNEVNNESALSPEELAEKNRKRAIIEAAIERARLQKAAQEQKKS